MRIVMALCLLWAVATNCYLIGGIRADQRSAPRIAGLELRAKQNDSDWLTAVTLANEAKHKPAGR